MRQRSSCSPTVLHNPPLAPPGVPGGGISDRHLNIVGLPAREGDFLFRYRIFHFIIFHFIKNLSSFGHLRRGPWLILI